MLVIATSLVLYMNMIHMSHLFRFVKHDVLTVLNDFKNFGQKEGRLLGNLGAPNSYFSRGASGIAR